MDSFDLETSLRKIDSKFADDLTYEEKRKALKKFRKLYACSSSVMQNRWPS